MPKTTNEIRAAYLDFFASKSHKVIPSSSLLPENDPTTLFTGSGMQPMLPYLLGEKSPYGSRIVDSQKCVRAQDIEEVGDNRHTTFFEMLGNWSLGDYFKREQISWMFEFLTGELGLNPNRLYFTCFAGSPEIGIGRDDEAAGIWQELFAAKGIEAKIGENPERDGMRPGERIFFYPDKKNWWSRAGVPANMPVGEPGGPDTEMFWDFDPENKLKLHENSAWKHEPCHVNCDCGRFMEIGNNVFMQFIRTESGFEPLAQKNVDFGGGLERLAAALRDDPDVFTIDLFDGARGVIEQLSGRKYGADSADTQAFRVILDHLRAATFMIADGAEPSNRDQGYFTRRMLRRAIRFAGKLGIEGHFCAAVARAYGASYAEAYPVVAAGIEKIAASMEAEETQFRKTLASGEREIQKFWEASGRVTGEDAFRFYETYGFPLELTEELLAERGAKIAEPEGFAAAAEKHADLSRTAAAGKFKGGLADHSEKTTALHTATHLMLAALRQVLGSHVHQKGSNITPERARFDFSHEAKMTPEEIARVEEIVNAAIAANAEMNLTEMLKTEAQAAGVEGSFWEKYPDTVKVYTFTDATGTVWSRELCGGPHVARTGDIGKFGKFKVAKEESSSAGVRRIKAVLE